MCPHFRSVHGCYKLLLKLEIVAHLDCFLESEQPIMKGEIVNNNMINI
jgi:hypothetical protein